MKNFLSQLKSTFKNTVYQDVLIKTFIFTYVISSLLATTGNVIAAISLGWIFGTILPLFIWKGEVNVILSEGINRRDIVLGALFVDFFPAQFGWLALGI